MVLGWNTYVSVTLILAVVAVYTIAGTEIIEIVGRLRTPVLQAFSYGIRHVFIAIH